MIPNTIAVIGADDDDHLLIWSRDMRRLHRLSFDQLKHPYLTFVCGSDALNKTFAALIDHGVKYPLPFICGAIADAARRRIFSASETLGQGVWMIGKDVLLVNGNDALTLTTNGHDVMVKQLDQPTIGNKLINFGSPPWATIEIGTEIDKLSLQEITGATTRLMDMLRCWSFKDGDDQMIVAGLIIATNIQGALPFRPQVWVTGPSNCGKTAMLSLLRGLWPYAVSCENETSEAAIRQRIGCQSLPLLLDEQENWRGRKAVIKLLHSSTRGMSSMKGTPSGKVMEFKMSHITWLSSVDVNLPKEADRNRFAIVELERPERIVMPGLTDLTTLGKTLLVSSLIRANMIISRFDLLAKHTDFAQFGRLVEVYAVPVAAYATFMNWSEAQMLDTFRKVISKKSAEAETQYSSDEQDLMRVILTLVPKNQYHPVSNLLKQGWGTDQPLHSVGIRKLDNGSVFIASAVLQEAIPRWSKWADTEIGSLLARLDGAKRDKQRINNHSLRGVTIPIHVLLPPDDEDIPF